MKQQKKLAVAFPCHELKVTERQRGLIIILADNRVWEVVEKITQGRKIRTDGNRLPEAKIYKAAAESDPSQLGYTDEERGLSTLFSQMRMQ